MLSNILFFGLGINCFLLLIIARGKANDRWPLVYFIALSASVAHLIESNNYAFIHLVLLPLSVRIFVQRWFSNKIDFRNFAQSVLGLTTLWILSLFIGLKLSLLLAYLAYEAFVTGIVISRNFRKFEIHWFHNSGMRIIGLQVFLLLNLLYLISATMVIGELFISNSPWLLVSLYLLISALAMLHYVLSPGVSGGGFEEQKYARSNLSVHEKYQLDLKLSEVFSVPDFYTSPDASLAQLAILTGGSKHQISQVINETRGLTFFELLTKHRVARAKELLKDTANDKYKMEEIAEQVGYLSKSSFNTSFKRIVGCTPSEYRTSSVRDDKVERLADRFRRLDEHDHRTFDYVQNTIVMIRNFFKVYLRGLARNKAFSLITYAGLVLGIGSSILIYTFIQHELSYDKFHSQAGDIYRVVFRSGNSQTRTPHPLAQAMVTDFAQVIEGVSLTPVYGPGLTLQELYVRNVETNVKFKEPDIFLADSTFLQVFDFKVIMGGTEDALSGVGDIVITESVAKRYFGSENPLGKSLEIMNLELSGVVRAVIQDPPTNSHFHPAILISYVSYKSVIPDSFWWTWNDFGHFNYIKLAPGTDPETVINEIPNWLGKYLDLDEEDLLAMNQRRAYLDLQPITDIHLHSRLRWELEANSSMIYIYILSGAIAFIILIAAINYVNLTTARVIERNREVGIRKTLGARKSEISVQFISESVFSCLVSLVLAATMCWLVLSSFNELSGKSFTMMDLLSTENMLLFFVASITLGLLSGLYPAVIISSVKPAEIIKGKFTARKDGRYVREFLIAFQFLVSAIMVLGSIVVLKQIKFMEDKSLGFNSEEVLVVNLHRSEELNQLEAMKSEIRSLSNVLDVGGISNLPGGQFNQNSIFPEGVQDDDVDCAEMRVDFDALSILGVEIVEGRGFDRSMAQDSSGNTFIINEAARDNLQIDDIFSQSIVWNEEVEPRVGRVVGIVNDFHFKSLHHPIQPLVININPSSLNYLLVKLKGENVRETIAAIDLIHQQFDADYDFDYQFLDSQLNQQYFSEKRSFDIFLVFTLIAIFLAALGLIGLAYLMMTQKAKEISVKKVLGANILDLIWAENKKILRIVVIALIVGIPISILVMQQWLQAFSYHTEIGFLPIAFTGILLIAVSIISVSLAILNTLLRNPMLALRSE